MRLTSILLVGLYASFTPLADLFLVHATLEISPPEFAFLRLYNEPNCEVKYHQTGYKDFQRVECRPEPNLTQCATGKFLSYRLEENPATPGMPKIDQLIVKKNTSVCEIEPDFSDAMVFQPHPNDNSQILTPGCHLFNPTSPLDIDTNLHLPNSFWCTYTPMTQESPFDAQQFSEDGAQMPMRGAPPLGEGLEDEYGDSMMDPEATPGGGPPGPNALLGGGPPGQYDDELDGPLPPSGPPGPPGPPLGPPPAGIPLSGLNGLPKGPPHGPPFGGPPGPPFGPPPPGFPPSLAPPRGPPMPPPPRHQGGHPPFPPPPYPFPPPQ